MAFFAMNNDENETKSCFLHVPLLYKHLIYHSACHWKRAVINVVDKFIVIFLYVSTKLQGNVRCFHKNSNSTKQCCKVTVLTLKWTSQIAELWSKMVKMFLLTLISLHSLHRAIFACSIVIMCLIWLLMCKVI